MRYCAGLYLRESRTSERAWPRAIGITVPRLEFKNFSCERDNYPLFNALSFVVEPGDLLQVAGPNGAGKTTFLRAMCGLFADWTGEFLWDGEALSHPSYEMLSDVLYLGHQTGVKKSLTAKENLEWYFGAQGRSFPGSVESALEAVGLKGYEDSPCQEMSAGQMRRVALARLYVSSAKVWVLDEPFTAIDKKGVANLETLLMKHASKGGSVILTTHQALDVEGLKLVELQRFSGVMHD